MLLLRQRVHMWNVAHPIGTTIQTPKLQIEVDIRISVSMAGWENYLSMSRKEKMAAKNYSILPLKQ